MAGFEPVGNEYLIPAPAAKKQCFDSRKGYPACGVVFEVNGHDNQQIEQAFVKQRRQRVVCRALVAPARGLAIDPKAVRVVSAFVDLHHTRQGNNPAGFMSPAERQRWIETIALYTRHNMPRALRDFMLNLVNGRATNLFSPIYVDPEAYPLEATRVFRRLLEKREREEARRSRLLLPLVNLQKHVSTHKGTTRPAVQVNNNQGRVNGGYNHEKIKDQIDNLDEHDLPQKAYILQGKYYEKHGILAPPCPVNDKQAKIYEDYHDEVMRGQVDVDFQDTKHLKATINYWDRISERCDDGLDVLDAIKESRGEGRWIHPYTAEVIDESEDEEEPTLPQPKLAHMMVTKKPSNVTNDKATNMIQQIPYTVVDNKRQRPQNPQEYQPTGQPPAKKQKVQQPGPPRSLNGQQNREMAGFTSTLIPVKQQRPAN